VGTDGRQKRYIQADTLRCEWQGVKLTIDAHNFNSQAGRGIRLKWETPNGSMEEIALIPDCFQTVRLVTKEALS
jgi:hypothetical protein